MSSSVLRARAALALGAVATVLSACGGSSVGPHPAAASAVPTASDLDIAIEALNRGDEVAAQKALKPLLKREPNNPEAHVLLDSMKDDPVALLGAKSFAYTAEAGDTMIGLSERFLGNRIKFYQLARYNGVKVPADLAAGTVLKIPGDAPKPAAPPPSTEKSKTPGAPKKSRTKATGAPVATPPAIGAAPKPAPAAANPAMALKLRGAGLAALNQGKLDQAVPLLRRAAALDPSNALIARDLARAERIAQTVKARK